MCTCIPVDTLATLAQRQRYIHRNCHTVTAAMEDHYNCVLRWRWKCLFGIFIGKLARNTRELLLYLSTQQDDRAPWRCDREILKKLLLNESLNWFSMRYDYDEAGSRLLIYFHVKIGMWWWWWALRYRVFAKLRDLQSPLRTFLACTAPKCMIIYLPTRSAFYVARSETKQKI